MSNMRQPKPRDVDVRPSIGVLLRERRSFHGWTLAEVSEKTGISKSALSKIENGLMSPTYHTIIQLCTGLGIEISDLMSIREDASVAIAGRRSVSLQRSGQQHSADGYKYVYLCSDVVHKRMIPILVEVSANSEQSMKEWAYSGEEFIYVLKGSVVAYTEFYQPIHLEQNDSMYFDSVMRHGYIRAGADPAVVLLMCSSATPNLAQRLREILIQRIQTGTPIDLKERAEPKAALRKPRQDV